MPLPSLPSIDLDQLRNEILPTEMAEPAVRFAQMSAAMTALVRADMAAAVSRFDPQFISTGDKSAANDVAIELTFLGTRAEITVRSRLHWRHTALLIEHEHARIIISRFNETKVGNQPAFL